MHLEAEAGLAPMSPLGVVSDGVTSAEANPLGNGTVLLLGFSKLLLGPESLVARHFDGGGRDNRVVSISRCFVKIGRAHV